MKLILAILTLLLSTGCVSGVIKRLEAARVAGADVEAQFTTIYGVSGSLVEKDGVSEVRVISPLGSYVRTTTRPKVD